MTKFLFFTLVFLGLHSKELLANSEVGEVESFVFNGGLHTEFFNYVHDSSGEARKFDYAPTIGGGVAIPLKYSWSFLPEINWVLPKEFSSKVVKNLLMFRADFGYDPLDWLRLRAGTSLMLLNQHGRGGSAEIANGNSTTTFYYPDENHSSWNNTFDLGVEGLFNDWSVRLQTYTYSLFKSERRQVSYTLFISYYWDR